MIKIEPGSIDFNKITSLHIKYINNVVLSRVSKLLFNNGNTLNKKNCKLKLKYRKFIEGLFGKTQKEICNTLKYYCTSSDLESILKKFKEVYREAYGRNFSKDIEAPKKAKSITVKNSVEILNKILNYDDFNRESSGWSRHKFISSLGIKVCPYCNRNYITSYEESVNNYKTTADADHYYPKSKYPILQLNIYNMIPSCNVCNSKMKNDFDKRHLYPYEDGNDSLSFSVPFDEIDELYNYSKDDIKISIIPKNGSEKAKNSIEAFKLDKVYKIHNDIVFELKNKIKDSMAFRAEEYYKKLLGYDFFRNEEWSKYWFDFLEKDPLNEPLIKLKQDIYYQIENAIVDRIGE